MRPLSAFQGKIKYLFHDIDDTITTEGQLPAAAYEALWRLKDHGILVIPVTGRPAGWCEMIARFWPVAGVIGENGALYFRYYQHKMSRSYALSEKKRVQARTSLDEIIAPEILKKVKGARIASDQFCRLFDLAIDYAEDVKPLPDSSVQKIQSVFKEHGATSKVSSIHVNGWFGNYDKVTMCKRFAKHELDLDLASPKGQKFSAFVGDSPNDEPSFQYFKNSFAVANIKKFATQLKSPPQYISKKRGGEGFVEIVNHLIFL